MKMEKITTNFNERGARKLKRNSYAKFSTAGATCGCGMIGDYVSLITDNDETPKSSNVDRKPICDEPDNSWGLYCYVDTYTNQVVYVGMDKHIQTAQRDADHRSQPGQVINRVIQSNPDRYQYVEIDGESGYSHDECAAREIELIDLFGTYENRVGHGDSYGFNMMRTFDDVNGKLPSRKPVIDIRTTELPDGFFRMGDWEVPMWDHSKASFDSRDYQRSPNHKPNDGGKCFRVVVDGAHPPIGAYFHDYLSAQIVSDFIAAEL